MTPKSPLKPLVSHDDEATLVLVESEPFAAFDRWMDEQLSQLVAKWAHMASPRAQRSQFPGNRFGR
jgi:hypothetical protein